MHLLIYILTYPLIKFISILPFGIVYKISNIVSFLLHKVFKYRLKTVKKNLNLVFPNKDIKELDEIGRAHVRTPVTEKSRMPSSA